MDEVDDNSDSDQELESQELEVALYSQIHFDLGTQAEQWLDSNNYSYPIRSTPLRIGVKELPVRITSCLKQPVLGGEFIAFSQSKSEDDEGGSSEPHDQASSHQDKHEIFGLETTAVELDKVKSKGSGVKKQTVMSSLTSDTRSSNVVKCHRDGSSSAESKKRSFQKSQVKSPVLEYKVDGNRYKLNSIPKSLTDVHKSHNDEGDGSSSAESKKRSFQKSQVKSPVLEYKVDGNRYKLNSIPKGLTDVHKSHNDEGQHKKLIKEEIVKSTKVKNLKTSNDTDLKEKELYLPYSVTKTSKKKKVTETPCGSIEKETIEVQPLPTGKKKATNSLPKLESFLKLPKSGAVSSVKQQKQKRASLTKTVAAVKPRTPKFFVRRPPATVVKYRQDSDTNTDYSDSDVSSSSSSSPVKEKHNTSKDALVHNDSVSEDPKLFSKNTMLNVTESITQDKSDTSVRAGHQADPFDKVRSNKPERVATSSQDVSMGSEDEDESEIDEDMRDKSDLQEVITVDSSSGDSGSSQEEPATDSEDTDSSDSEEFMAENIPGLEFNLDRGMAGFAVKNPDNWKINEKDRFSITSALSRYFFPRSIQCRNCKVEGHLSRDCPKPLKRRCIFCGKDGHQCQACPDAICFNCSAPGHRFNECKEQKINRAAMCNRCWMSGHDEKKCPDRWRQYHITTYPTGNVLMKIKSKGIQNPLVFCYNCGKKGHLGYECRLPRMNKFTTALYPFVAKYETKKMRQEMRQNRKGISESPRTANLTDKKSEKQRSNRIKNKGLDRDERHRLKNKRRIQEHEDEYTRGSKKRRWSSRERADSKTGGGNNERNHPVLVRNQRSDSATFRRQELGKGDMDDIFTDFGKHQVNDNEWWNRKSVKKRRKKNADKFVPEFLDGDQQRDSPGDRERPRFSPLDIERPRFSPLDRERSRDKDITTLRGSRTHQFESKRHGEERKRDRHLQSGPGKSRHRDFMPEFQFNQQVNHAYENSKVSNYREREGGGFSSRKHSQEYRSSFSNETSRKPNGQHTIFQKQDSVFPHQQGGFQVRNDRFVALERNRNITVRFRK